MIKFKKISILTIFLLTFCLLNIPVQVSASVSLPDIVNDPSTIQEKSSVLEAPVLDLDLTAPSGYSVSFNNDSIDQLNATNFAFTIHDAEIGTQLYYWIYDGDVIAQEGDREPSHEIRNYPNPVMITNSEQVIPNIDLSNYDLGQVVLVATLIDDSMNYGIDVYDYATRVATPILDLTAPSGYSVSFNSDNITSQNDTNVSFTIHNAEIGSQLYYWIYDNNKIHEIRNFPNPVMITSSEQVISNIDLSEYNLGEITLVATLIDDSMNYGEDVTDAVTKSAITNPSSGGTGYVFPFVQSRILPQVLGEKISGTEDRWVKTQDSSTVYFVDTNNIRHAYPNEGVWRSYFGKDFSFVTTITKAELATYSLGKNVQYKKGSLIKIPSVPKVYLVGDNYSIQWVKTEETAIRLYGVNWAKLVYDMNEAFFGDYIIGTDIE